MKSICDFLLRVKSSCLVQFDRCSLCFSDIFHVRTYSARLFYKLLRLRALEEFLNCEKANIASYYLYMHAGRRLLESAFTTTKSQTRLQAETHNIPGVRTSCMIKITFF